MLSEFHLWEETDKKIFVAKIIHEINYSQSKLDVLESLLKDWEKTSTKKAYYFKTTNTIQYGKPIN
jgi:hypothetical protein